MKDKNCMIISSEDKAFHIIQHHFMINTLNKKENNVLEVLARAVRKKKEKKAKKLKKESCPCLHSSQKKPPSPKPKKKKKKNLLQLINYSVKLQDTN